MDQVTYELVSLSKADDVLKVAPDAVIPTEKVTPPTQDLMYNGLELVVEVQGGSSVEKIGKNGEKWYFYTPYHYGYIKDTPSMEHGEEMDFFLNPKSEEGRGEPVYVAQLIMPDGSFNEEKVFLGFTSAAEAKAAFYQVYAGHNGFSCIVFAMTLDHFGRYINARQGEFKGAIAAEGENPDELVVGLQVEEPVVEVDLGANEGVAELTDIDLMIQLEAEEDNALIDAQAAREELDEDLELSLTRTGDREELLRKCRELRYLGATILKETREGPHVQATFSNEYGTGLIKSRTGKQGFIVEQNGRLNAVGGIVGFDDTPKGAYEKVTKEVALLKAAGLWNTDQHLLKVRSDKLEQVSKGAEWLRKARGVVVETLAKAWSPEARAAAAEARRKGGGTKEGTKEGDGTASGGSSPVSQQIKELNSKNKTFMEGRGYKLSSSKPSGEGRSESIYSKGGSSLKVFSAVLEGGETFHGVEDEGGNSAADGPNLKGLIGMVERQMKKEYSGK